MAPLENRVIPGGFAYRLRTAGTAGTVALWDFQEIAEAVRPVDQAENLTDLADDLITVPPLNTPAVVVSEISGRGREFDGSDEGMIATETVADSLRLTRNVTVRAFLRLAIDRMSGGEKATIVVRGKNTVAAERLLFGVDIERITATTGRIRARWAEIGGIEATVVGVVFPIDPTKFFELAVIREWIDTTTVNVTYMIDGEVIGTEVVADGDIGEGVGGTLAIGAAYDVFGVYERFLPFTTILDSLSIESDAMSPEEIRQDFRRITVHQPNGYRALRGYLPPGTTYSQEPDSRIQRWVAAEGDGLGFAFAQAEQLREDILPNRAYNEMLEQWESLTGLSPGPSQTVAARRTAVLSFLRKTLGFPVEDIKTGLELAFGLDDTDIEIFEFTGLRTDDFSVDDIGSPPSPIWVTEQGNGTITVAAGACRITAAPGSDLRWAGGSPRRLTGITGQTSEETTDQCVLITKVDIVVLGLLVQDVIVGHIWKAINGDMAVMGYKATGAATRRIYYAEWIDGVLSTPVDVSGVDVAEPRYLLTRYNHDAATFTLEWEAVRANLNGVGIDQATLLVNPQWAGFGMVGTDLAIGDTATFDFDDAEIFEPDSPRGFVFIAYRDPALGGTYNLDLAQQQIDKQSPAHSHGAAIDDKDGFTLGPTGTGRLGISPLFPSGI